MSQLKSDTCSLLRKDLHLSSLSLSLPPLCTALAHFMSTLLNAQHTTQVTCSPSRYKQTPGFDEVFCFSLASFFFSSSSSSFFFFFFSSALADENAAARRQNGKECRLLPCRVRSLTLTRSSRHQCDHCGCCYLYLARQMSNASR